MNPNAVLRRLYDAYGDENLVSKTITLDDMTLEVNFVDPTWTAKINGVKVDLDEVHRRYLIALVLSDGRVMTEADLLALHRGAIQAQTIQVQISKLRLSFDEACQGAGRAFIKTVWGVGVKLRGSDFRLL